MLLDQTTWSLLWSHQQVDSEDRKRVVRPRRSKSNPMIMDLKDPFIEPSLDWCLYQDFYSTVYWMLDASWIEHCSYITNRQRLVVVTCKPAMLYKCHITTVY